MVVTCLRSAIRLYLAGLNVCCSGSRSRLFHRHGNPSLLGRYEALVAAGELSWDRGQVKALQRLQELVGQLSSNRQRTGTGVSPLGHRRWFIDKLLKRDRTLPESTKGLYLYGSVGAGKTMLMDLFYQSLEISHKQRVHFNAFMLDVHERIHRFKQSLPRASAQDKPHTYDPIAPVARQIANTTQLLCFDEFQVTDIADAVILKRLFSVMFTSGVVVVATSNRHPDDLYKNGLQRTNFLPFIDVLKHHCNLLRLDPGTDYRERILASAAGQVYISPNSPEANQRLENVFREMAEEQSISQVPITLDFLGRSLHVPRACGPMAFFSFQELCAQPLSAADYLELCRHFDTLFIRDVPQMSLLQRTEARRFITLIDTLYDQKVKVVCTAEVPIEDLFAVEGRAGEGREKGRGGEGRRRKETEEHYHRHHSIGLMGAGEDERSSVVDGADQGRHQNSGSHHKGSAASSLGARGGSGTPQRYSSLFTGEEEVFAFSRTVSRLREMQGKEYWNTRVSVTSDKINK